MLVRLSPMIVIVMLALGCADPVGDKPRATVASPEAAVASSSASSSKPPPAAGVVRYSFSHEGSSIGFVGAKVTKKEDGGFRAFSGSIDVPEGKPELASVDVEIDMASVFTGNERLTGHLKKPDFFDVAKFPRARFTSTSMTANADGTMAVTGNLTLRGVTKQITFPATVTVDGERAAAKAEFGINRQDFGVAYQGAPDDLVRDEVLLKLDVNAKK